MIHVYYHDGEGRLTEFYRSFTNEFIVDNPRKVNNMIAKTVSLVRKHIIKNNVSEPSLEFSHLPS